MWGDRLAAAAARREIEAGRDRLKKRCGCHRRFEIEPDDEFTWDVAPQEWHDCVKRAA